MVYFLVRRYDASFQKGADIAFQIKRKKLFGPYSQRNFKPRLTKHDFNDFSIGDKIDT